MIQRMSDQGKIKFLENNQEVKKAEAVPSQKKDLDSLAEEQKSKKMRHADDGTMTSKHISSAYGGVIREEGGPSKQIKTVTSNSIWNSNRLAEQAEDSKTRVDREKEQIASNRRLAEQKRMDEMVENLRKTEQSKESNVSRVGEDKGSSYYSPKNGMSIFDTKDFQRVDAQTNGERISKEAAEKRSQKDESWRGVKKAVNTKDKLNTFMDNLLNNMGKE